MARIIGGLATSHIPAIGGAVPREAELQNDPYWQRFFAAYPPAREWVAKQKPDIAIVFYNDHGLNFFLDKMPTFAIGAACAGVGGVYYASLVEFIEPGPFHFSTSLMMLLAVIVGGSGRFMGPVVGTIIIILLPEFLRSSSVEWLKFMQKWCLAFFGVAVIVLMIWLPGGILSFGDRFKAKGAAK